MTWALVVGGVFLIGLAIEVFARWDTRIVNPPDTGTGILRRVDALGRPAEQWSIDADPVAVKRLERELWPEWFPPPVDLYEPIARAERERRWQGVILEPKRNAQAAVDVYRSERIYGGFATASVFAGSHYPTTVHVVRDDSPPPPKIILPRDPETR